MKWKLPEKGGIWKTLDNTLGYLHFPIWSYAKSYRDTTNIFIPLAYRLGQPCINRTTNEPYFNGDYVYINCYLCNISIRQIDINIKEAWINMFEVYESHFSNKIKAEIYKVINF